MSTMTNKSVQDVYGDILQVSNGNAGVDATMRRVESGIGTPSALSLSTNAARVDGDLEVIGKINAGQITGIIANAGLIIDGGGGVISPGIKGDMEIPFDAYIQSITMLADVVGSFSIDLWRSTIANYPPISTDKINGLSPISMTGVQKFFDSDLIGWGSRQLNSGNILRFNVNAAANIKRLTFNIRLKKS